jgi:hypothetical protein
MHWQQLSQQRLYPLLLLLLAASTAPPAAAAAAAAAAASTADQTATDLSAAPAAQFPEAGQETNRTLPKKPSPAAPASRSRLAAKYEEVDAVLQARMALAAFAGYHKKLRFATDAQLMCPSCSLPKGLNVSTVQQLGPTGAVVATAMVGRVGSDELILAFAADSPDGFNPLSGLFVLEHMDSAECAGLEVYKTPLTTWHSMRQEVMSLLALHAREAVAPDAPPLRLRVSGYSAGASVAPLAALEIAWALERNSSGLPSSRIRLGPVHTFGNGAMGNLLFKQCFDHWVGRRSGHFAVVHGRDPLPFLEPPSWHKLTPLVFYDGPGGNATDWHSHNFSICNDENAGCDEKYRAWVRNPVHILAGFCHWHSWYADLDAVGVYCGSTTEHDCGAAFRLACSGLQGQGVGNRISATAATAASESSPQAAALSQRRRTLLLGPPYEFPNKSQHMLLVGTFPYPRGPAVWNDTMQSEQPFGGWGLAEGWTYNVAKTDEAGRCPPIPDDEWGLGLDRRRLSVSERAVFILESVHVD